MLVNAQQQMIRWMALATMTILPYLLTAQDTRFEMVDEPDSLSLEISLPSGSKTHIHLDRFLRHPAYVLDQYTFEVDNHHYALLSIGFPSRGEYTATGMCASGSEETLLFLAFNEKLTDVHHQVYPGASCLRGIYPDIQQDGKAVNALENLNAAFEVITIQMDSDEQSTQFILSKSHLAAGLVMKTTN